MWSRVLNTVLQHLNKENKKESIGSVVVMPDFGSQLKYFLCRVANRNRLSTNKISAALWTLVLISSCFVVSNFHIRPNMQMKSITTQLAMRLKIPHYDTRSKKKTSDVNNYWNWNIVVMCSRTDGVCVGGP